MKNFLEVKQDLLHNPKTWLITGVAGFIGSNILEELLLLDQRVVGVDNFSTGHKRNLEDVREIVGEKKYSLFNLIEGDIREIGDCRKGMVWRGADGASEVDYVLHQAALGSVPRSINDPINTNNNNITGFLNTLVAARDAKVKKYVYAASSSTYGDHPGLPKMEEIIGNPLSPYAVTKYVNELYAQVFFRHYGISSVGLRYFNVFGKRQDPDGAYAAVIPKWIAAMMSNEDIYINGDGETSRDFCYIRNAIQANILAAVSGGETTCDIFNVAVGGRINLNKLFETIKKEIKTLGVRYDKNPIYRDFRSGDVMHSQASIAKIVEKLGYDPTHDVYEGMKESVEWYFKNK